MGEEQGHKLRLVAVLLAGPLAQFVGVEEQLRPPTRLVVVVVVGLLLVGLAAVVVVVALELLRLLAVVGAGALGAPSAGSPACSFGFIFLLISGIQKGAWKIEFVPPK